MLDLERTSPSDPVHDRVRREFARQSDSFAAQNSFFGSRDIGAWIAGRLPLEIRRQATARDGIANVEFLEGDASNTSFADAAFDLVMSRFALHHMVASDDAATTARFNELEPLRDPSHPSALTAGALEALVAAEGEIVARDTREQLLVAHLRAAP